MNKKSGTTKLQYCAIHRKLGCRCQYAADLQPPSKSAERAAVSYEEIAEPDGPEAKAKWHS